MTLGAENSTRTCFCNNNNSYTITVAKINKPGNGKNNELNSSMIYDTNKRILEFRILMHDDGVITKVNIYFNTMDLLKIFYYTGITLNFPQ